MRTIIAGSRSIVNYDIVKQVVQNSGFDISVVISGGARGIDALGERWAREYNKMVERYPADWKKFGRKAGYLRNVLMATKADACIVIWDGKSPGSNHMQNIAREKGLKLYVEVIKHDSNE